ncbi:MAG: CDP-alcohol phosphatidyltransferase family protein [Microthrixaceae bacterium]|nr:CDP-alcohol phosphatidyltransferase family protein [Microthrixaceae bacterium]
MTGTGDPVEVRKEAQKAFGPSAVLTPANVITLVRLLLSPVVFWLIIDKGAGWGVFALWLVVTASDSLDGYLARRQGTTRSGAFLDPLADKVLALGGLWAVVLAGEFWWFPVALVTLREAVISAFRSYWARHGLAVQASKVAKAKTFLQFSSVSLVIWPWTASLHWLAQGCLWLAVVVAWVSALQYIRAGSRATSMGD